MHKVTILDFLWVLLSYLSYGRVEDEIGDYLPFSL